jgi:hypothetical protein
MMGDRKIANPWSFQTVDAEIVERLASHHSPYPKAVAAGVDICGDPHAEDNDGYNWSVLSRARNVADVVPGSAVIMGSAIGNYLARVVAWDFEVSDQDPMVIMELLPVTPREVARALARSGSPAS